MFAQLQQYLAHSREPFKSFYDTEQEKCCRTVPMRVLVLGLSRTGTECEFPLIAQSRLYVFFL